MPSSATRRPEQKQVRNPEQEQPGKPVWRFHTVDLDGPFSWPKGTQDELSVVARLHQFDCMSWGEIEGGSHHILSPSSLSREAIMRLEQIEKDDLVDKLFSFRMQGRSRFIAIRDRNIANLLWYDPEHGVAPSNLKHT